MHQRHTNVDFFGYPRFGGETPQILTDRCKLYAGIDSVCLGTAAFDIIEDIAAFPCHGKQPVSVAAAAGIQRHIVAGGIGCAQKRQGKLCLHQHFAAADGQAAAALQVIILVTVHLCHDLFHAHALRHAAHGVGGAGFGADHTGLAAAAVNMEGSIFYQKRMCRADLNAAAAADAAGF